MHTSSPLLLSKIADKSRQCRRQHRQHRQHRQRGVALITAMVITVIAVTLAATLVYRQQVSIRLAGNLGAMEQAYQYATGMESWAGIILQKDFRDNTTDSLDDDWATLLPPIPIPGGHMSGQLFDLQGRLNLNDVVEEINENNQKVQRPDATQVARLRTLFNSLHLESEPLVDSLIDWVDRNDQESLAGAESAYYKVLEPPYLAANTALVSFSELRLIKGFDGKVADESGKEVPIVSKLTELVSTLPAKKIKINVNTAPFEVLYALGNIDEAQVNNVLEDRQQEPFATVADFVRSLGLANPQSFPVDRLGVSSEYFLLKGLVQIGKVRVFINSTLYRDNRGRTHVIRREFSES